MTTNTILALLLSILVAGGLSFFLYFYKVKTRSKVYITLACLRFFTVFCFLLLLINPIISRKTIEIVKTPLPLIVDNSASIVDLKANKIAKDLYSQFVQNKDIQAKFNVQSFQFDATVEPSTDFSFTGKQTNLDEVAKSLRNQYRNTTFPTVIITDGNQTSGNEYSYSFNPNNKVYPLIVGDTTTFLDLKISNLNVNKYAFQKNKFPVEVFLNYAGTKTINADLNIFQGNSSVAKQTLSFSPSRKSVVVNLLLPADKVGMQVFKAVLFSNQKKKNNYNNSKNFAVEIINQRTTVTIVSAINHPDIGALKRAIESNAQRTVLVVKPSDIDAIQNSTVLILYQPTRVFKSIFERSQKSKINTFIVTGNTTDFNFLNEQQSFFTFKMSSQKEEYMAEYISQFNLFATDNLGFENFPPLQNPYGTITKNREISTLLNSTIKNISTGAPLLSFVESQGSRSAFLFGENIWKWRMQAYLNEQSFDKFDVFIDKIIQFLSSNDAKKSLVVNYENFYNAGEAVDISAQYFNKNYEFDDKAQLTIAVSNSKTKQRKNYDLIKGSTTFKVNLDGLSAGSYDFSIQELNSKTSFSGHFEVLDFDIEKQFVNPDVAQLNQLAKQTKGRCYCPNQVKQLLRVLLENEDYKAIQKEIITKTPLIDWQWLLVLIATTLAVEWFLRKYNGML